MEKEKLFESLLKEDRYGYDPDDEISQAEYEELRQQEKYHRGSLIGWCQDGASDEDPRFIITSVKDSYSEKFWGEKAVAKSFHTINQLLDFCKEKYGTDCIKIIRNDSAWEGCTTVRAIDDYDD